MQNKDNAKRLIDDFVVPKKPPLGAPVRHLPVPIAPIEPAPVMALEPPLANLQRLGRFRSALAAAATSALKHSRKILILAIVLLLLAVGAAFRSAIKSGVLSAYHRVLPATIIRAGPPPVGAGSIRVKGNRALNAALAKITGQTFGLEFAGTVVKPPASVVRGWISEIHYSGGYTVLEPNPVTIGAWLSSETKTLSKPPSPQVAVTHTDGTSAVLQPGVNGLSFGSDSQLLGSIEHNFVYGKGVSGNLPGVSLPYSTTNQPTLPKLIEVDVTTKKLYAYQNGALINTFLVTAGAPATPTPLGTFHIWEKLLSQNMYAYYPDGQLEYYQPNVLWVNYFDHDGDAIHGNYWRPLSYFGHVNSSHGCVGLINSQAEWIYNWAPIGTTVVIHA